LQFSITPDILQHRDELSKFIGDEIARTLLEQKNLERRYEILIEQRAAMKGMVNKNKYKEVQEEIQDVSRALKESTNNLVRSLKDNPNISGNLIKVQRDRTELNDNLLRCIQEIRDRGKYTTLTHKVDEENNAKIRFQQLKSREKGLSDAVIKLQETLKDEQQSFQHTTTEQKHAILTLKEELLDVKGSTSTDSQFRRKESQASVKAIWREYKHKEHQLEIRLKELEDKLHTENVVNNETKDFLSRRHAVLSEKVAEWEQKYETDLAEVDSTISIVNLKRTALLEKLSVLQQRRAEDMIREEAEMEQERLKAVAAKEAKVTQKKQNRAARTLQRELKSFVKRKKELEAIKGDGKKKGKGAKSDKKGKKK
jgi:IQ domain-containing protein G